MATSITSVLTKIFSTLLAIGSIWRRLTLSSDGLNCDEKGGTFEVKNYSLDSVAAGSAFYVGGDGKINKVETRRSQIESVSFGPTCPFNFQYPHGNGWTYSTTPTHQKAHFSADYDEFTKACGHIVKGENCRPSATTVQSIVRTAYWSPHTIAGSRICVRVTKGPDTQVFTMPTCKSGIGSVLIEDYWKNKALTVVTSREPHGRVAHLNMQSQIVGPYTLKILHTEINNGERASAGWDVHAVPGLTKDEFTRVTSLIIYEPTKICTMGGDLTVTFGVSCIPEQICEETKETYTVLVKDDTPQCATTTTEHPIAAGVQLFRDHDGTRKPTFHMQSGSWNNHIEITVDSNICIASYRVHELYYCTTGSEALLCEDEIEPVYFIKNGDHVKNEDGSPRLKHVETKMGANSPTWTAQGRPIQIKNLAQKPAVLMVKLTNIVGGSCARRLNKVGNVLSYDDQRVSIPITFAPEGNKPATPPIFSMPAKSGDVQRDDDVTSGEARNAIAPYVWPLLLTLCAWFVSA